MRRYSNTQGLGLSEYKIKDVLSDTSKEVDFRLRAYKRKRAKCSGSGEYHNEKVHRLKEVIVEDLPILEKRVYLHVIKRRYRCLKEGRVYVESVEWLKPRCRVSNRLAKEISGLRAITTNTEAGWYLGLTDERVYRIDKSILEEQAQRHIKPTPFSRNISDDEVSWKKYYRYLTNVVDVDEKVITWNENGRKSEVLDKYYESLGQENCGRIESVSLDGARPYISSSNQYAVNGIIVLD